MAERMLAGALARPDARRTHGIEVGGSLSEKGLGGSRAVKTLMGPAVRFLEEPELDSSFEISPDDGRGELQLQGLFEGVSQALHDSSGARLSDRAEAMLHIETVEMSVKLSESKWRRVPTQ